MANRRRDRIQLDLSHEEGAHLARVLVQTSGWLSDVHQIRAHFDVFRDLLHLADPAVRRRIDRIANTQVELRAFLDEDTFKGVTPLEGFPAEEYAFLCRLVLLSTLLFPAQEELHRSAFRALTRHIDDQEFKKLILEHGPGDAEWLSQLQSLRDGASDR